MNRVWFWGCLAPVLAVMLLFSTGPIWGQWLFGHRSARPVCLSNVKQTMLGEMMYLQDNDERFPPAFQWADRIYPYVKDERLFRCPSLGERGFGYAMDSRLGSVAIERLPAPADTLLLFDTTDWSKNAAYPAARFATRHNNGGNVGFADGHAKWKQPEGFAKHRALRLTPAKRSKR